MVGIAEAWGFATAETFVAAVSRLASGLLVLLARVVEAGVSLDGEGTSGGAFGRVGWLCASSLDPTMVDELSGSRLASWVDSWTVGVPVCGSVAVTGAAAAGAGRLLAIGALGLKAPAPFFSIELILRFFP